MARVQVSNHTMSCLSCFLKYDRQVSLQQIHNQKSWAPRGGLLLAEEEDLDAIVLLEGHRDGLKREDFLLAA